MPAIEDMTTMQIVAALDGFISNPNQQAYIDELKNREIKTGDADDTTTHKGGIRPEKAPRV